MTSLSTQSTSSNNVLPEVTNELSLSAKLRRLKIQENVLLQNVLRCSSTDQHDLNLKWSRTSSDFKIFTIKNKQALSEITKIFHDIKTCVYSQETLKKLDIDDVKEGIIELENCIKKFKISLQTEIFELKSAENQLKIELYDIPQEIGNGNSKKFKIPKSKYNEIVPSPVRLLMNSPFKSMEVQEFQEFMKKSRNRYGGWKEYNHNIFVNSWNSHFCCEDNQDYCDYENFDYNSPVFEGFVTELLPKLQGQSVQDLELHTKWYLKYLYLKNRQHKAILKWRSNQGVIKKPTKVLLHFENEDTKILSRKCKSDTRKHNLDEIKSLFYSHIKNQKMNLDSRPEVKKGIPFPSSFSKDTGLINNVNYVGDPHFSRPTKQWSYKCNSDMVSHTSSMNLDDIKKLGIPIWRAELH